MTQRPDCQRAPTESGDLAQLRWGTLLAAAVLVAAGIGAYWNSFSGQLVLDDRKSIVENPSITDVRDLGKVLRPPRGLSTSGRPLVNLTLAINYAIGGAQDLWSYHAVNLAIHVLAALVLMGVVRRTLISPPLRDRFGRVALPLAAAVALLWMLHPLQVQAVTYITQRAESMVSLMYLLTLYCTIRSASPSAVSLLWAAGAVLACAAGMASKEVMVTAPVTVLVYDRLFLAGGWRGTLARRRGLYAGLAATWLILAALMWPGPRSATVGFGIPNITPLRYAATQLGVILYYLRLAVWPSPLVADYVWPWARSLTEVLPAALAVGALVAATCWLLWRGRPLAMAGVWFFLILAPTSSIVPITEPIFEYRMYLPLAAIVSVAVLGGWRLLTALGRKGQSVGVGARASLLACTLAIGALAAALGWLTHQRNQLYASEVIFWQDVVDKQPHSGRGHSNLGSIFLAAGKTDQALEHLQIANQNYDQHPDGDILYNLALALGSKGRYAEAEQELERLLAENPADAEALALKGFLATKQGKTAEASEAYLRALQIDPNDVQAIIGLANVYLAQGKSTEAKTVLSKALQLRIAPITRAQVHYHLGRLQEQAGRLEEAESHYRQGLQALQSQQNAALHKDLSEALDRVQKSLTPKR
ncbi:MAG: tetratricopeptide repeat protein [Phycisphaerae bacterium]|nr:tetratricopeptide repeat protein [Phycisphaerae bacterium]